MNNDMLGLLNLAYEIEGLLLLNINRGDEAAPEMKSLLTAKAAQLYTALSSINPIASMPVPPTSGIKVSAPEPNFAAEVEAIQSAARETVADKIPAEKEEKTVVKEDVATPVKEETVSEKVKEEVAVKEEIAPSVDDEAIADSVLEEEVGDADVAPTVNDSLGAETQLTLDEKLARQRASDISKAFTINDRFRFRRELFRNSDEEFKETLEVIGSMSSMEEAEDYFFNDLCWDESSPEVKEFMEIVGRHF